MSYILGDRVSCRFLRGPVFADIGRVTQRIQRRHRELLLVIGAGIGKVTQGTQRRHGELLLVIGAGIGRVIQSGAEN